MEKTIVITHRGLKPTVPNYPGESSIEAFRDQIEEGFGLEFDPQFTADGGIVIIHDATLKRITKDADLRNVKDVSTAELLAMEFDGCHLTTFAKLLDWIADEGNSKAIHAIHLKHGVQQPAKLDSVLKHLEKANPENFILFDVSLETARYIKAKNPELMLAPSVAHPYDIARYNDAVGGTLLSVEEVLANKELFDWVWLDEWDLADKDGGTKTFYNEEVFTIFKNAGLKIALVTPELHGTSPGLLGGEAHPEAKPYDVLMKRITKILALQPDALCTDHPDAVREMIG